MVKTPESEREILRHAAEAAAAILPKLEQDRADLDERIASLKAAIAAHEAASGKRSRKLLQTTAVSGPSDTAKVKRGQVAQHVESILQGGGDYEEPELRKLIHQRFGVAYGRPSIYSVLRRGLKAGRYEQKEKRWRMKVA
jgi:hypothetical protein